MNLDTWNMSVAVPCVEVLEEVFSLPSDLATGKQLIDELRVECGCLLFGLS